MFMTQEALEANSEAADAAWTSAMARAWERLQLVLSGAGDPVSADLILRARLDRCAEKLWRLAVKPRLELDAVIDRDSFRVLPGQGGTGAWQKVVMVAPEIIGRIMSLAQVRSIQGATFLVLPTSSAPGPTAAHVWLFPEPDRLRLSLRWSNDPKNSLQVQALPGVPALEG